jgi:hypothetical protein
MHFFRARIHRITACERYIDPPLIPPATRKVHGPAFQSHRLHFQASENRSFSSLLCHKTETVAVPIQDFDNVPFPVAEAKQMTGQWIEFKLIGYHNGKAID